MSVCLYVCLSVCLSVCEYVVFNDFESCTRTDSHKSGFYGSGRVWANVWGVVRRTTSRGDRDRRAAVDFVVFFEWGGIFLFSFFCFASNAHGLMQE